MRVPRIGLRSKWRWLKLLAFFGFSAGYSSPDSVHFIPHVEFPDRSTEEALDAQAQVEAIQFDDDEICDRSDSLVSAPSIVDKLSVMESTNALPLDDPQQLIDSYFHKEAPFWQEIY